MEKENFMFWLESCTSLSNSTIKKYAGAINTISKEMKKNNFPIDSLYNINDPNLIEALKIRYFSLPEFQEKDIRGNRMYSNALKYFKKFIEEV